MMNINTSEVIESIVSKTTCKGSIWISLAKSIVLGTGIVMIGGFYLADVDKQVTMKETNLISKMLLMPKSMVEAIGQKDYVRYQQIGKIQRQFIAKSSLETEPVLQMLKSLDSYINVIKSTDAETRSVVDSIRELTEININLSETLAVLHHLVAMLHEQSMEKLVIENQKTLKKISDVLTKLLDQPEAIQDIYFDEMKKIDENVGRFEQNMNLLEETSLVKRNKEILRGVKSINNEFHAFVKIQHDFVKKSGPYLKGVLARTNFKEEIRFFENYLIEMHASLLKEKPLSWLNIDLDTTFLSDRQQNLTSLMVLAAIYISLIFLQQFIKTIGKEYIDESLRDLRKYTNSMAQYVIRLEHTCYLFSQIINGIFIHHWDQYIKDSGTIDEDEIVIRAKESSTWCDELDRNCQQLKNTTTSQEACIKSYEVLSSKCLQNIKELSTCSQSQQQVINRFEDGLRRLHTEMDQVKSYRMKILQLVDELQVIAINSALNGNYFENEGSFAHRLQGLSVDITLVLKRINQFFMNTEHEIKSISNQVRIIDRSNNLESERLAQLKSTVENMYESSYQVMCKDSQLNRLVSEIDHYLAKFHQMTQRMLHTDVAAS